MHWVPSSPRGPSSRSSSSKAFWSGCPTVLPAHLARSLLWSRAAVHRSGLVVFSSGKRVTLCSVGLGFVFFDSGELAGESRGREDKTREARRREKHTQSNARALPKRTARHRYRVSERLEARVCTLGDCSCEPCYRCQIDARSSFLLRVEVASPLLDMASIPKKEKRERNRSCFIAPLSSVSSHSSP